MATMVRRKAGFPISLFSFQDIIMSVVGIVILITLILLLQLVSQMLATPPSSIIIEQELRQQLAALQPILKALQDSIVDLHRAKEQSEILTPSVDRIDAIQSSIDRLESDIALTERKIVEVQKRIEDLQNNPAIKQLTTMHQEIEDLTNKIADLKQQTKDITDNVVEFQAKIRELNANNTGLDKQLAERAGVQLKVSVPKDSDKTAFILDYGQGGITVIPTDGSAPQKFSSRTQFSSWISMRDYKMEHFVVYVRPSRFGQYDDIVKDIRARGFDVGLQVIGEKTSLSLND